MVNISLPITLTYIKTQGRCLKESQNLHTNYKVGSIARLYQIMLCGWVVSVLLSICIICNVHHTMLPDNVPSFRQKENTCRGFTFKLEQCITF